MTDALTISTTNMHTCGDPLKIVTSGVPPHEGTRLLDKRRYFKENLDYVRKFLMFEPRGHNDIYGGIWSSLISQTRIWCAFLYTTKATLRCVDTRLSPVVALPLTVVTLVIPRHRRRKSTSNVHMVLLK